ncbi:hypothetical protein E2562_017435 [Oryza meyeriana var. granulata]|uniref:Uncharacterized protein n=1 Tax=Oryza meyeriana var. granulata TaxID=110450 RepID=A0A6G1DXY8_9ORYZ|nr:hypothetical protein E2562_017435 [Oryza meyeriana var. granulata]
MNGRLTLLPLPCHEYCPTRAINRRPSCRLVPPVRGAREFHTRDPASANSPPSVAIKDASGRARGGPPGQASHHVAPVRQPRPARHLWGARFSLAL